MNNFSAWKEMVVPFLNAGAPGRLILCGFLGIGEETGVMIEEYGDCVRGWKNLNCVHFREFIRRKLNC